MEDYKSSRCRRSLQCSVHSMSGGQ